jgi:hypothetical protein
MGKWCGRAHGKVVLLHIRHNKYASRVMDIQALPPYADVFCLTWDRAAMTLADMNRTRLARGRVFICEFEARPHLGLNSAGASPRNSSARRGALSRGPTTLTGSDCSRMQTHP